MGRRTKGSGISQDGIPAQETNGQAVPDSIHIQETRTTLIESEERYRAFFAQSSEGIWRFELEQPLPVDLPLNEQVDWAYKYGFLAECNDAMARQYGHDSAESLLGVKLGDLLVREDPNNTEFINAFIKSGYRLNDAESHERDIDGNDRYFVNNFIGIVEDGYLLRAWGSQRDVTASKAEDQIRARLAAIVESSDDAIISFDLKKLITSWNAAATKIYGYSEAEAIGRSMGMLIPESRTDEEDTILEKIRSGEKVQHFETQRKTKSGKVIDVSLTISPIRDEADKVIGISKITRDISDRKATERELSENRLMLAMAMQSSRMGVWERDIATGQIAWSPELESIFGLSEGEFNGTDEQYYSLIHEDDRATIRSEVERAVSEKRPYSIEFRFYHSDGSVRWMEGRGEAVYSDRGEPVRLYGIGLDITERKQVEQQLNRQAVLVDAALEPVITWEFGGPIIDWNRGAEIAYGYTAEEAVGKVTHKLLQTTFPESYERIEAELKKSGSWIGELTHKTKFGETIVVESRHQLIQVGDKKLVLEANRDITERKRVGEELQRSEARLQAMFDSTTVGIAVLDLDNRFLQINDAFCDITGFTRAELLKIDWKALTRSGDVSDMNAGVELLKTGKRTHLTFEKRYLRKDGSLVWVQSSVSMTRDEMGEPLHLIVISQDVSARKLAEEQLELLSRMPAENPHPVFRISKDGQLLYSNPASDSIVESWNRQGIAVAPELLEVVRNAFSNGGKQEIELEFGGRVFHLTVAPFTEAGYVNIYGTDITAASKALLALQESEQRFSRFMQQLPGLAWIKDIDGKYVYANESALRSFGVTKEDLYGKSDEDVFPPASARQFKENDRLAIESDFGRQFLESLTEEDGTHYSIVSKFPISDPRGKIAFVGGMAIDITEQKQAELDLRRQMEFDEAVMSNMAEGLFTVDIDGRVTSLNPAGEILLGWKFDELSGRTIHDAVHYKHRDGTPYPASDCPLMSSIRQAKVFVNRGDVFVRKDGSTFDVLLSAAPMRSEGKVTGGVVVFQDVTERKRAEEQLERYRHLSEHASDIIWLLKEDGTILEANQAAVDTYRFSRDELIGMNVRDLRHPSRRHEIGSQLKAARAGNIKFETIHQRRDGSELPVEVNATSAEFSGERLIMSIVRDITERKQREKDHAFLLHLADAIRTQTEPALLIDRSMRLLREHLSLGRCFFSTVELEDRTSTIVGESCADNLTALDSVAKFEDYSSENLQAALAGRTIVVDDTRSDPRTSEKYSVSYGPERIGSYVAVPQSRDNLWSGILFAVRAEPYQWKPTEISLIETVSERVWLAFEKLRSEAALRESERRAMEEYQRLLERIVPLAETLGAARDLRTIYRSLQEFISASMFCSGFFVSFYNSQDQVRVPAFIWGEGDEIDIADLPPMPIGANGGPNSRAILGKQTVITNNYYEDQKNRPHVILHENGIDPMSSLVVPMVVQDRVIGTLEVQAHQNEAFHREHAIALEMAANLAAVAIENVRLIETEAHARTEAETANRMKDEFLSVLSHELRTPLNAMLGWVRILRGGNVDVERMSKALEIIERNTRQQSSLIEDLLDVSRIISGKMRIEQELIDLIPSLEQAVESVRPQALTKSIAFDVDIAREPIYVKGDAVRLQQVITNLLQNAIKFTASGGKVSLKWKRNGPNVIIEVADTGIGIDPQFLPMIFDRFSQADASTRRSNTGLGLGLTIVRTIVELHDGSAVAHSEGRGQGSVFTVTLPLAEEFYRLELPQAEPLRSTERSNSLRGVRILVVDDDQDGLTPLRILLEKEGAIVTCVLSASEALDELGRRDFDILISDIGMPLMDGFELISKLKADQSNRNHGVRTIAYTAYASEEDKNHILSSGYEVHLAKPLDMEELLSIVRNFSFRKKPHQNGN